MEHVVNKYFLKKKTIRETLSPACEFRRRVKLCSYRTHLTRWLLHSFAIIPRRGSVLRQSHSR